MVWALGSWRRLFKRANSVRSVVSIPSFVSLGDACTVDPLVQFRPHDGQHVRLADHVTLYRNCELCGDVTIGSHSWLNRDVYVRPHTHIGAYVSVGPFTRFVTDSHELSNLTRRAGRTFYDPIEVGDGAWIGASVTILGGVKIGRGAVIGAGAVVTRDVEPDSLYAGVPARKLRDLPPLVMRAAVDTTQGPPHDPRPLRPAA